MPPLDDSSSQVLKHPGHFAVRVLKSFRANQGLLLAPHQALVELLGEVVREDLHIDPTTRWVERDTSFLPADRLPVSEQLAQPVQAQAESFARCIAFHASRNPKQPHEPPSRDPRATPMWRMFARSVAMKA